MPEGWTPTAYGMIAMLATALGAFASGKVLSASWHKERIAEKDAIINDLKADVQFERERADRATHATMLATGAAKEIVEMIKIREREGRR